MRYMFIGIREDQDGYAVSLLDKIPHISLLTPEEHQRYAIQWDTQEYPDNEALLFLKWRGTVPSKSGTWQIWQLAVVSQNRAVARKLFRFLGRATSASSRLLGPWGLPKMKRIMNNILTEFTDENEDLPLIIAGDNVAEESAVDYDPT